MISNSYSLDNLEIKLPPIKNYTCDNGVQICCLNPVKQEIFHAIWEFDFCKDEIAKIIPNPYLLHKVIAKLLGKKTKQSSGKDISLFFDEKGADISIKSTSQTLYIRLSCLSKYWDECVHKVHEILSEAVINEKIWRQGKKKILKKIEQNAFDTEILADQMLLSSLSSQNTYWNTFFTKENLQSIHEKDLQNAYTFITQAQFLRIYIFGNWEEKDVLILKEKFGKNPNGFPIKVEGVFPLSTIQSSIQKVDFMGGQYSLRWGKLFLAPKDKDYAKALMATQVLGGYFGSRLMQSLREKEGLTYGAYAYLVPFSNFSIFVISTEISKENLEQAQSIIEQEIINLQEKLINEEEWQVVKNNLLGDLLSSLDGPLNLINRMRSLDARKLRILDFEKQIENIQKMQREELHYFMKEHFSPDSFIKVWKG